MVMKRKREERPQRWWFVLFCFVLFCCFLFFCFVFKDGSVFIVFEEDANKAEAREREVIKCGQRGHNRESDQELKGITHPMQ